VLDRVETRNLLVPLAVQTCGLFAVAGVDGPAVERLAEPVDRRTSISDEREPSVLGGVEVER
jgi:hypothetical protein